MIHQMRILLKAKMYTPKCFCVMLCAGAPCRSGKRLFNVCASHSLLTLLLCIVPCTV